MNKLHESPKKDLSSGTQAAAALKGFTVSQRRLEEDGIVITGDDNKQGEKSEEGEYG